jgi:hypothetical protein
MSSKFNFTNALDREYDDTRKHVNAVVFDLSRYGDVRETIAFAEPVSEKVAIEAAEQFLSQPLYREHYDRIKEDLYNMSWEEAKDEFELRGDCISSDNFLESADVSATDGVMHLFLAH